MATILLRPPAAVAGLTTMAVSLSAAEAISSLCGTQPKVKWPNDLIWPGEVTGPSRKLAGILAEADWPAGSPEQLSGDFYAACMDESQVDALGLKPAQPMLDEIDAIRTAADVEHTISHLHDVGIGAPFALYAAQDLHDPTQMVADINAGGLGMPDRDYYLKTDKRFVDARAKYLEHVQKMFDLAGAKPDAAKADAASTSQPARSSVPPVGAAIATRRVPPKSRISRSPQNSASPTASTRQAILATRLAPASPTATSTGACASRNEATVPVKAPPR